MTPDTVDHHRWSSSGSFRPSIDHLCLPLPTPAACTRACLMHGLLVSVRCKSGGAGFSKDDGQTSLLQWGGRRVAVELQGWAPNVHIYSPGLPSTLPLANFTATVHPPHLPCGAGDSIPQLASASGKEGVWSDQRVEDHVEYIAAEMALVRHHALEVVHRKCDLGPSTEKRGRRLVDSNATLYPLDEGAPVFVLFRERDWGWGDCVEACWAKCDGMMPSHAEPHKTVVHGVWNASSTIDISQNDSGKREE